MSIVFVVLGLIAAGVFLLHLMGYDWRKTVVSPVFFIIVAGFLIRVAASFLPYEFGSDVACFKGWSKMLFEDGLSKFYTADTFTDYPPGYMYVLYVLGAMRAWFNIDGNSYTATLLIKLPSILADIGIGIFIYKLAAKRASRRGAIGASMLYVMNPAVILISACWGQVDSIHTLLIALAVYSLVEKKILRGSLLFALAVLVKPQALMFTPLFIYAYFEHWHENKWSGATLLELFESLLASLLLVGLLILPFAPFQNWRFNIMPVVDQYVETLSSYPYVTVNAWNFYALLGLNWKGLFNAEGVAVPSRVLGIPYDTLGIIALVLIVFVAFFLLYRAGKHSKSKYFLVAAFLNFGTFMFSVKMHERYSFPIIALLVCAYVYKGDKRLKTLLAACSAAFFLNYMDVLRWFMRGYDYEVFKTTSRVFAGLTVAVFGFLVWFLISRLRKNKSDPECMDESDTVQEDGTPLSLGERHGYTFAIDKVERSPRFTWRDFASLGAIVAVYAVVAFVNLGNMKSPQSGWLVERDQTVELDFGSSTSLQKMQFFLGARANRLLTLSYSEDRVTWNVSGELKAESVFSWGEFAIDTQARYVKLTTKSFDFHMMEIAFRDAAGQLITPEVLTPGAETLLDEQELVPVRRTYMNSTHFDEIYHPRTAYEFIEGMDVYEWTHPPLGKVFISLGISAFGMTPFGWRFVGTLFGVLMLPFVFLFARRMFKKTFWASFATILFALDFMHLTQTRLATIDTYITFFVIAMYYFMYRYYTMSFYHAPLRKTLVPLFLSGLCMGLGIACKWPGMYAGLGLAVLFGITMVKRYREYDYAKKNRIEGAYQKFPKYAAITCACCVGFFIIIPLAIYLASYIPYYFGTGSLYPVRASNQLFTHYPWLDAVIPKNKFGDFVAAVTQNQFDMFGYHSKLDSPHAFSSTWWMWILNVRPIFYYAGTTATGLREGINAFGNPLVWWGGIAAIGAVCYRLWKKFDKVIVFILIGYAAQLLPWMLVSRTTYIYHYFPSVIFLVLAITYVMKTYCSKGKLRYIPIGYLAASFVLLVMFYPVLVGLAVPAEYVKNVLRWLPTWQFI